MAVSKLEVGRVYRSKRPHAVGHGYINDRQVLWISAGGDEVHYDSPALARGVNFKCCSSKDFLKWAKEDITEQLPKDGWMSWEHFLEMQK